MALIGILVLLWKDTHNESEQFFGIVKTLLSFAQVLSFPTGNSFFFSDATLDSLYHHLITIYNTVGGRVFSLTSLDCLIHAHFHSYYVDLIAVGYLPLLLCAMLLIWFYGPFLRNCYIHLQVQSDQSQEGAIPLHASNTGAPLRLLLFIFLLIYPYVSTLIAQFFQCQHIAGAFYLIADFSSKCFDSVWHRWLGFELVLLVLYPLGGPLVIFLLLKYKRLQVNVAFMTAQYKANYYYWDV